MLINPNISEIKKEYTQFILNILVPLLYEGIQSIYKNSIEQHARILEKNKNSLKSSPGILKIFQTQLKEIPSLNTHKVNSEANRIRESSKCASWFDNLIKAVIKSNIMLLTMEDQSYVNSNYHENISTENFIHKCYIECAKIFYANPYLFWHEYDTYKLKKNQQIVFKSIRKGIKSAIRGVLPMKDILNEYLSGEYIDQYENNYNMIRRSVEKILAEKDITHNIKEDNNDIKVCYINKDENIPNPGLEPKLESEPKSEHNTKLNIEHEPSVTRISPHVPVPTKKPEPKNLDEDARLQSFINNRGSKIILDFNGYDKKGKVKDKGENKGTSKDNYFAQYF